MSPDGTEPTILDEKKPRPSVKIPEENNADLPPDIPSPNQVFAKSTTDLPLTIPKAQHAKMKDTTHHRPSKTKILISRIICSIFCCRRQKQRKRNSHAQQVVPMDSLDSASKKPT